LVYLAGECLKEEGGPTKEGSCDNDTVARLTDTAHKRIEAVSCSRCGSDVIWSYWDGRIEIVVEER
jgi:hypothetical protein